MSDSLARFPRGILASAVVPWDESYGLMEDLFREQVARILAHTPLVYVMGTAGEGYAVSDEQFRQVTTAFAEEMRKAGAEPMVGVINMSATTVHARIDWARSLGVRDFQISLPSWGVCTPVEAARFIDGVCSAHPDCRFLHYNLARAGRLLEPDEYAALSERNPNLVATKNSSQVVSFLASLQERSPRLRHFITDLGFCHASLVGECGLLTATTSCNPLTARRYYDAGLRRDTATLLPLFQELLRLLRDLFALVTPHGHMDGAYDKMYVKLTLPRFPLRLLPPYSCVPEEVFERFAELLRTRYPRWYPS